MLSVILIIVGALSAQVAQSFYNDSQDDFRHRSCRFRSIRQAEFDWDSPRRSMTESFVLDDIEYKLCRYHVTWDEALVFCSSHRSHLATLDSDEKTAFVVQAIASSSAVSEDYWIGARKLYDEPWSWNSNAMTMTLEKNIIAHTPIFYGGLESNDVYCLAIDRNGHDEPIFVPRDCNQRRGFICQRDNDRSYNKIRMVASSRINEQEFRLYAGRLTWAEAVVQCRQEGLQIAEVRTVKEARILAISMLRNRPEGIESAWIGGYTRKDDPETWRWLASGDRIEKSEMWRKNVSDTRGGCLLLDRHVCETPVYVETYCDRRRDVLCQKPPKKVFGESPTSVIVDGCSYSIGFRPLRWSDARRSCESLNSSLIVLDSPATISHMMRLMLDNKAELRHVWTDGRRSKTNGQWKWSVNGRTIPDLGKSFIPWCADDDYGRREDSCLNLDRENLDSPIVYGLSCREKQTYVCQPLVGDCVFHPTSNPLPDAVSDATRDMIISPLILYDDTTTLPVSTVTTPYAIADRNYGIVRTSLDHNTDHVDDPNVWKPVDDENANYSASSHDFSRYLNHFSRFTLPSLPQFGVKVVSATETTTTNNPNFDHKKKKSKAYKFFTNSSHVSTSTIVPIDSSSFSASSKKLNNDGKKISKISGKSTNFPIATSDDFSDSTISSTNVSTSTEKISKSVHSTRSGFVKSSNTAKTSSTVKKSTKASKVSTTMTSVASDEFSSNPSINNYVPRTKKYTIKTTRDADYSNSTKILSPTTTIAPNFAIPKNEKINPTDVEDSEKITTPKISFVDKNSFVLKKSQKNSTLVPLRRQNFKVTTEATTPYDAVDEDYYNDDKDDYTAKKNNDENDDSKIDDYSDDYDSTEKSRTKKKMKQTSTASIRKNHTTRPKTENDDDDDDDEETTTRSSIPTVQELSKNLENALIEMMKNSVEKSKNETSNETKITAERKFATPENVPWIKQTTNDENMEINLKSSTLDNFSIRPYYAFEGPMIMNLGKVLKTRLGSIDTGRDYRFIGKKYTDENSSNGRKKMSNNDNRRRMNNEKSYDRETGSRIGISGMPPIKPNDPNSLMQLGRYFKNTFAGAGRRDGPSVGTRTREETPLRNERRRYGTMRRPQERIRGYSTSREDDYRGRGRTSENSGKSGFRQTGDGNYYDGSRRLYPRGNYGVMGSPHRREDGRNDDVEARPKLDVSWPEKKFVDENFDETGRAVSPRSFAYPIRTTRSFHEETGPSKSRATKRKIIPDFKLSKLVKEVKIDLDGKTLKSYLEGFARKIARQNLGVKDDWRSTWRRLLRQMILILDRMNINVNGEMMKLKFGNDDGNEKIGNSPENNRETMRKTGSRKQRKDSLNPSNGNYSEGVKHTNVSLKNISKVENRSKMENSGMIISEGRVKDEARKNYGRTYDNAIKKSSKKETIEGSRLTGKSFLNREEMIERPEVNDRESFRSASDGSRRKWTNFSDARMEKRRQSVIPVARLSTVIGYRPLMPQLHHRMIFQPGWNQIRPKPEPRKPDLGPENLPKGTLSRIVSSDPKNDHFATNDALERKNSTGNPKNPEKIATRSFDRKTDLKTVDGRIFKEDNANRHLSVTRATGITLENDSTTKERNKLRSSFDFVDENYGKNNVEHENSNRNKNSSRAKKPNDGENGEDKNEEKVVDDVAEETKPSEDYERKPIMWTPAHRLTKALELSVLRKFGGNSGNSLRSKNLVTRSAEKTGDDYSPENSGNFRENRNYVSDEEIDEIIDENAAREDEERSIVNLRLKMNDEKKSSRILKRSDDFEITDANPRTVEMSLQFFGNNETTDARIRRTRDQIPAKKNDSNSRNETTNKSLQVSSLKNETEDRENMAATTDRRDRISRNVGATKKKTKDEESSKDVAEANHYVAEFLRSFESDNPTNGRRNEDGNGAKSRGRDSAIDWGDQASAVFADLKETDDDLTLYVDLTLARVGSKPRNGKTKSRP